MAEPHVLICDDEADLREMLAEYLLKRGFRVSEAGNAAELRQALRDARPDAILLDIAMPGEDGLSVLRGLATEKDALPVLMLTAAGDVVDRVVGLELGADDYLAKPVDLRELVARIKAVLRRRAVRRHARRVRAAGTRPDAVPVRQGMARPRGRTAHGCRRP
jgi:DNA-binding response OmpR family regulator